MGPNTGPTRVQHGPKMGTNTGPTRVPTRAQNGYQHGSNMGPTRVQHRSQHGPKMGPNTGPNRVQHGSNTVPTRVQQGPTRVQHGSNTGPIRAQYGSNTGPNTGPTQVQHGSNTGPTRVQHGSQHGSNTGPHGSNMGPNMGPNTGPTRVQHGSQHGYNTGPTRVQHGSQHGPKMGPTRVPTGSNTGPTRVQHGSNTGPTRVQHGGIRVPLKPERGWRLERSWSSSGFQAPYRVLAPAQAPRIITFLETLDVLMDHNATFICEVESRPPADVTWTKNNHPIMYYDPRYATRAQGQMLIIPHVRESDSGEYCCIATNGVGEPAKSCGALQLKMKPQIKRHPTNLTLLVEAKAVLPCVTLGNPKPDVTWLKDDELIKISDRVTILDYGALKIHNIQKEDAGQYRCVARNSFGLSISKPVSIEVQVPARILQVPKERKVAYGSLVSLECNATGNPVPTITWLENGNTVSAVIGQNMGDLPVAPPTFIR
ncbi:Muscle, skeletal receptor tyrosine-protein kinase [Takifugu flavidus]|uniref:Muscle, skeletal receptor tyrosine-protein kinase n=1 Tax=Takifugu flavidus TaxID=433684 RepID=A0A5C6NG87_9TELE|nr:Muscle, skeletal receptor tyrosine-protein kinase [Takifugu flavidus]